MHFRLFLVGVILLGTEVAADFRRGLKIAEYDDIAKELVQHLDFTPCEGVGCVSGTTDDLLHYPGVVMGERFSQQLLSINTYYGGKRDTIIDSGRLSFIDLIPGKPGRNLTIALVPGTNNWALYPEGPVGFPDPLSSGMGAVSMVFAALQDSFAFKYLVDPDDPSGPDVFIVVGAYDRRGVAVGQAYVRVDGDGEVGFFRPDGQQDIHAITIYSTVPNGIAIDDFVFDRLSLPMS